MSKAHANGDINDQDPNQPKNPTKKLSKEHYIELAAFCDSIYDRGKTKLFYSDRRASKSKVTYY